MMKSLNPLVLLAGLLLLPLTGCEGDTPNNGGTPTITTTQKDDLSNLDAVLVLNEGNMSNENGTLSLINPVEAEKHALHNIYRSVNASRSLGNVAQDLALFGGKLFIVSQNGDVRGGDQSIVLADGMFKHIADINPQTIFRGKTNNKGALAKYVAVAKDHMYVLDSNSNFYYIDLTQPSEKPVKIADIKNPISAHFYTVKEGSKYFVYVASKDGKVNRINTEDNAVETFEVKDIAHIYNLVAPATAGGRLFVFGRSTDGKSTIVTLRGEKEVSRTTVDVDSKVLKEDAVASFATENGKLFFFTKSGWAYGSEVYMYDATSGKTSLLLDVKSINPYTMIYGTIAYSAKLDELYVPVIESYAEYKHNAILVIGKDGKLKRQYSSIEGVSPKAQYLDSRFPAGVFPVGQHMVY